ncbi:DNA mismatch repair protein MutS [Coemansia spiralis]|nr:DNA mismatch repair protein MutS [Coemansia spiralis]
MDKSPGDIYTQIVDAESEVCLELQSEINCHISDIAHAFDLASRIDCLQSLAALATLQGYCQPKVDLGNCVHIAQGHHPVLAFTSSSQQTISNNMNLMSKQQCLHVVPATNESQRTLVLAGPNASGKSIFLKQSGLIVYMAHIGCHVPALQAVVGLTDRIMVMGKAAESLVHRTSALGADLATVASMIELSTPNTFILLDEFGRGTSPADGMGLLCGVLASLSLRGNDQPAVLAVTHFHEIMSVSCISHIWPKIQLKSMEVKEGAAGLVYLYRVRGVHGHDERVDTAYAIECARNAGVPHRILRRAQYILNKK